MLHTPFEERYVETNMNQSFNNNYINILRSNQNWDVPENKQFNRIAGYKLNIHTKIFIPRDQNSQSKVCSQKFPSEMEKFLEISSKNIEDLVFKADLSSATYSRSEGEEDKSNSSMISTNNNSRRSSGEVSFKAKYKTEICKFWELNKTCKFGDSCAFAHGNNEMRQKIIYSSSYKTKKCKQFFDFGFCLYGSRCQFLHQEREINNLDSFSYKSALKNYDSKSEKKELKRLRDFEDICKVYSKCIDSEPCKLSTEFLDSKHNN